jgi:hypothetical protein
LLFEEASLPKLLAGWLLALLLLVPAVWTARFLPDELAFCNLATLLAQGKVFGKEAFCLVMPGGFMLAALVFKLGGPSLVAARLLQAAVVAAMAVTYAWIGRRLGLTRAQAALPAAVILLVIYGVYFYFGHRWFSQAGIAATLATAWWALGQPRARAWLAVGAMAGVTYGMQQLDGAGLLLGLLGAQAWLGWREGWRPGVRRLGAFVAGWALPLALLAAFLALQGGLAEAFYDTHTWAIAQYRRPGNPNDVAYLTDLSGMLTTTGPWISRTFWYANAAIVLVGPLLPLLVTLGGLAWLAGLGRARGRGDRVVAFCAVLACVCAGAFLAALRARADVTHLLAISSPHWCLLAVALARWEALAAPLPLARGLAYLPRALAGAFVLVAAYATQLPAWRAGGPWLASPDAAIAHHPSIEALKAMVRPGDTILAGMHTAMVNFYVAPAPTRFVLDWTRPEAGYTTPAQYAELLGEVAAHRPRLVVVSAEERAAADALVADMLGSYAFRTALPSPLPAWTLRFQLYVYERKPGSGTRGG